MRDKTPSPDTPELGAFIERNRFHLDDGWIDLGANQLGDDAQCKERKGLEDATGQLMREMASEYNTAVVSAAYYQAIWSGLVARAADWSAQDPAADVQRELLSIFARSYVLGLDGVQGCANELTKLDEIPGSVRALAGNLVQSMTLVRDVRDSIQHIEERVQGKARGKRIPASILLLGDYSDGGFMFTTGSGVVATIVVSESALASVRSQISALDRSLTWRRAGPVCPVCGGSIRPLVNDRESADPSRRVTVEWHCRRCGFRQRVGT